MTFAGNSPAQSRKERMPEPRPMLGYEIVDGDTLYFDIINPSKVTSFRKMKGREWRRYYRLVWNFSKTYPYALVARKLIEKTDAELEENDFSRRKREKYINDIQKELFDANVVARGKEYVHRSIQRLKRPSNENGWLGKNQNDMLIVLQLAWEMYLRGYSCKHVNIYKSDAEKFIIHEKSLMPPITSLTGIGKKAANAALAEPSTVGTWESRPRL